MNQDDLNHETFSKEIASIHELLREVSGVIKAHYHADDASEYQQKTDSTPLTQADIAAHRLIEDGLKSAFPSLPVLSEESSHDIKSARHAFKEYWLVDPLDGTREFLDRTGEFTINVAMIRDGYPSLGFIAAPLLNRMWYGGKQFGSYAVPLDADMSAPIPISCSTLAKSRERVHVLSSVRHKNTRLQTFLGWLETKFNRIERSNSGSALKFCQLAEGVGDIYPRFSPCCEWDTGAGQAIVEGAGGAVIRLDGERLSYNQGDSLMSPHFLAIADPDSPLWSEYLELHQNSKM